MSDYTQITDFSAKDVLGDDDPEKIILGEDIDAELAAIADAIASKTDFNRSVNSQSGNYTAVLADQNTIVVHPSGAGASHTYTIPANSAVAYPVGTALIFVNLDSNSVAIAITTDTLTLAGAGTTGSRTLGAKGMATALKVGTTDWLISGPGTV